MNVIGSKQYNTIGERWICTISGFSFFIKLYNLNDEYYTAKQLCSIIQNNKEYIFEVWDEEDNEVTQKRYELFLQGAHKFLDNI